LFAVITTIELTSTFYHFFGFSKVQTVFLIVRFAATF
jgi:hypothetical protein